MIITKPHKCDITGICMCLLTVKAWKYISSITAQYLSTFSATTCFQGKTNIVLFANLVTSYFGNYMPHHKPYFIDFEMKVVCPQDVISFAAQQIPTLSMLLAVSDPPSCLIAPPTLPHDLCPE